MDIPLMISFFLARLNQENQKAVAIRARDQSRLQELHWPGNVRELENLVHSAFLMEQGNCLNFGENLLDAGVATPRIERTLPSSLYEEPAERVISSHTLEEEEIAAIKQALRETGGIQVKAARMLGVSIRQLRYRIKKYRIAVRKLPVLSR